MHLVLLFTVQVMHQVYKVYLFLILNISRFADLTKLNCDLFLIFKYSFTVQKYINNDKNEILYKEMTEERNKRKQWAEKRAATDAFGSSSPNGAGNALNI